MAKLMPGYRIKLSNQGEEGLVVNADTEERARELALLWAKEHSKDDRAVTIVSCELMAEDDFYVSEGRMWTPGEKV